MIISCSRRTDIPAFFAPWLMNRIAAGYCTVPNPMNPRQIARVSLAPPDVCAIVFWTKNAAPLLPHLSELSERGYHYTFQYTFTGYGRALEPHVPGIGQTVSTFTALATRLGPERVVWRYDPIVVGPGLSLEHHVTRFRELASLLRGTTTSVVVSILDLYKKTQRHLAGVQEVTPHPETLPGFGDTMAALATTAAEHGMEIKSCAEEIDLRPFGIAAGKCADSVGQRKDPSQRAACGCVTSRDIGAYDTCKHGCRYCYATRDHGKAGAGCGHDPESPSLVGWVDLTANETS
jgi:hypothetical protein